MYDFVFEFSYISHTLLNLHISTFHQILLLSSHIWILLRNKCISFVLEKGRNRYEINYCTIFDLTLCFQFQSFRNYLWGVSNTTSCCTFECVDSTLLWTSSIHERFHNSKCWFVLIFVCFQVWCEFCFLIKRERKSVLRYCTVLNFTLQIQLQNFHGLEMASERHHLCNSLHPKGYFAPPSNLSNEPSLANLVCNILGSNASIHIFWTWFDVIVWMSYKFEIWRFELTNEPHDERYIFQNFGPKWFSSILENHLQYEKCECWCLMIAIITINESKCNFVLKITKKNSLLIINQFKLFTIITKIPKKNCKQYF